MRPVAVWVLLRELFFGHWFEPTCCRVNVDSHVCHRPGRTGAVPVPLTWFDGDKVAGHSLADRPSELLEPARASQDLK